MKAASPVPTAMTIRRFTLAAYVLAGALALPTAAAEDDELVLRPALTLTFPASPAPLTAAQYQDLPPLLELRKSGNPPGHLPEPVMTLSTVVRRVLEQHPDIRSSQALLNAAEERIVQSRSNYYPTVGLETQALDAQDDQLGRPLDRTTRTTDAFLRWNLFRGFGDRQGVRMTEHDREAADADLAETHERVALQVAQAYLEVFRLRYMLALGEDYIADHLRLSEDVRKRVDAGRVSAADLDEVRASLIQAELQQSQLRGQLRGAEQRFWLLADMNPGKLTEPVLDDTPATMSVDALMEDVRLGNRRVRGALERASARTEEVGVAAAALYPSLNVEVRRRLSSSIDPVPVTDTKDATQFQVTYEMPLGGASFSRRREAVERMLAAGAAADTELLRARAELVQVWAGWQEARKIAPRLAERVDAQDMVVRAYDLQFAAARRSLTDLINARADRYRARGDLLDNRIEQLAASVRVLNLLGRLREHLLSAATPAPETLKTAFRP